MSCTPLMLRAVRKVGYGLLAIAVMTAIPALASAATAVAPHQGHGTAVFIASANFVARSLGVGNTSFGAFEGRFDVPLTKAESEYICSMQRAIPYDTINSFTEWLGGIMADIMGRDVSQIMPALKDPFFCLPRQAATKRSKADVIVHLNVKNVVVSTNAVWNACVSRENLTRDLIRTNKDTFVRRQRTVSKKIPLSCRDYHRGDLGMWRHPDFPGLEIQLDSRGRLLGGLPTGFVARQNVKEPMAGR